MNLKQKKNKTKQTNRFKTPMRMNEDERKFLAESTFSPIPLLLRSIINSPIVFHNHSEISNCYSKYILVY